jgi:hypothetical protein
MQAFFISEKYFIAADGIPVKGIIDYELQKLDEKDEVFTEFFYGLNIKNKID